MIVEVQKVAGLAGKQSMLKVWNISGLPKSSCRSGMLSEV